jgi:ABC-2 type transport system permease protein
MTETTNIATTTAAVPAVAAGRASAVRLPSPVRLLAAQVGYQLRQLLSNGRTVVIGIGLPVILLIASKGRGSAPDVAGYAAFGLTIIAWPSFGIRLVAARESGVLKRWRASPLPRWCYLAGAILAITLTAVIAGGAAVAVAAWLWGSHFDSGPSVQLTVGSAAAIGVVFTLAALAWASAATAAASIIPNVEAALPTFTLVYFPLVIVSGVLFPLSEPHWLSTLVSYLPAQPMVDAARNAVHHGPGVPFIPARDAAVLAAWAVGGLLVASLTFRWEPHRSRSRARTRAKHEN